MRINFNRLSQLAGLPGGNSNRRSLYEGKEVEEVDAEEGMQYEEMQPEEGMQYEASAFDPVDLTEEQDEEEEMEMDELIEVDETMLVQELRRAKRIMNESKRRRLSESRRQSNFNKELKQVIDEEVQKVISEMDLSGQWVYGNNRPTRSRKGYSHQGSFLPGFGFKR